MSATVPQRARIAFFSRRRFRGSGTAFSASADRAAGVAVADRQPPSRGSASLSAASSARISALISAVNAWASSGKFSWW